MGVGIDEVAKPFRLQAASAVADAVGPTRLQHLGGPRGSDEIIFQKGRVPEMKVDRETIHLDVQEKRGREVAVQFQSLESLSLV